MNRFPAHDRRFRHTTLPRMNTQPLPFLLLVFAGWVNRRQVEVIDYLKEENRVLREKLGKGQIRLTDD